MVYGVEKARHLHSLNNGTGEPVRRQAKPKVKTTGNEVKAYESKAGETVKAAPIVRPKVADEHLTGADRFVLVMIPRESGEERSYLASRVKSFRTTL